MRKIIFSLLILVQILLIGALIKNITNKEVLGTTSINTLSAGGLIYKEINNLKYFYEMKPNAIIKPEVKFDGLENISYKINADGLNQIENYSLTKNKDVFRIVTIGDSFTFGQNVNTEDNYPSQLQDLLNKEMICPTIKKIEIFNLGVPGYDIQYAIERLRNRGIKYDPDLVLWLIIPDDLKRINELQKPLLNKYEKESRESGKYKEQIANKIYYANWQRARNEITNQLGGEANILISQRKYMAEINFIYTKKLVFLSFPDMGYSYKKFIQDFQGNNQNMFFFDALPDIKKTPEATLPDLHPSKKGHTLIAKSTIQYLLTKKIIPCSSK